MISHQEAENANKAASASGHYLLRRADMAHDHAAILRIWQEGGFEGGADSDTARLSWFYERNPESSGQLHLLLQSEKDEPIGTLGIGSRRLYLDGAAIQAGVLVDFVVHPHHRTLLPALQLQKLGRERAFESKSVLYGIPNEKSLSVCLRAGYNVHFNVVQYCRVLRLHRYLKRYVPQALARLLAAPFDAINALYMRGLLAFAPYSATWADDFDSDFDRMWEACDKAGLCIGNRDSDFLRWRFSAQPDKAYRVFRVSNRSSSELRTWFVCEWDGNELLVKDCLALGGVQEVRVALLLLSLAAYRDGAETVRLQMTPVGPFPSALRRSHFLRRGRRLGFAQTDAATRDAARNAVWYVTPADEDV